MAGTKEGSKKMVQTMIKKFGSEEAWRKYMKNNGSLGGTKTYETGQLEQVNFKAHPERARIAGRKGSLASRRSK